MAYQPGPALQTTPMEYAYHAAEQGGVPAFGDQVHPPGKTQIIGADYAALMGDKRPFGNLATRAMHGILAVLAEFFSSLVFILFLTGAAIVAITDGGATPVSAGLYVAVATAFVVGFLMYVGGPASGGHFNPAITLGVALSYVFNPQNNGFKPIVLGAKLFMAILCFVLYFGIQIVGALSGSFMLKSIYGGNVGLLGLPVLTVSDGNGLLIEWFGTFVIGMAFMYSRFLHDSHMSPWIMGIVNGGAAFFAFGLTGASFNPIRFLGPAIATGNYTNAGVYIGGPLLGILTTWVVWEFDRFILRGHYAYVGWQPFTYKTQWQERAHQVWIAEPTKTV